MITRLFAPLTMLAVFALAACGGGEPEPAAPGAGDGAAAAGAGAPASGAPAVTVPGAELLPAVLPPGTGELQMRVTDAPPEGVSAIVVTISGIQVHKAEAGEEDGWITLFAVTSTAGTTSTEPRTFDLVQVTGIEQALGTQVFAVGKYTQIRMDVDSVVVTFQPKGGTTTTKNATVPGDRLKVVRPFDVEEGQATILTLDFDAAKSVIITGQGDVRFKPVVKLLTRKEERGKRPDAQAGERGGRPEERATTTGDRGQGGVQPGSGARGGRPGSGTGGGQGQGGGRATTTTGGAQGGQGQGGGQQSSGR